MYVLFPLFALIKMAREDLGLCTKTHHRALFFLQRWPLVSDIQPEI
jgi:hypothetical protein